MNEFGFTQSGKNLNGSFHVYSFNSPLNTYTITFACVPSSSKVKGISIISNEAFGRI